MTQSGQNVKQNKAETSCYCLLHWNQTLKFHKRLTNHQGCFLKGKVNHFQGGCLKWATMSSVPLHDFITQATCSCGVFGCMLLLRKCSLEAGLKNRSVTNPQVEMLTCVSNITCYQLCKINVWLLSSEVRLLQVLPICRATTQLCDDPPKMLRIQYISYSWTFQASHYLAKPRWNLTVYSKVLSPLKLF